MMFRLWSSAIVFGAIFCAPVNLVLSQELPVFSFVNKQGLKVSVPDAGWVRHRSRPMSSSDVLSSVPTNLRNRLCSKTMVDGVTTYDILHNAKPVKIVEHRDGRIEVTITKTYGPNDLEQLRTLHPDLFMHLRAFPKTTNGDSPVRMHLEIGTTYKAKDKSALQEQHEEAFLIYKRYAFPRRVMTTVTPIIIIQDE